MNDTIEQDDGVFSSVSQALHFSFLMEYIPASEKSQMQAIIERLMKDAGVWKEKWEDDLIPGAINFRGLTSLEIRGQCAMVRSTVNNHCTLPERQAIWAAYAMQARKAEGVRGLVQHVSGMQGMPAGDQLLALTWGLFCNRVQAKELSLRLIADHFGMTFYAAQKAQSTIRREHHELMRQARGRLEPLFIGTGLLQVPTPD